MSHQDLTLPSASVSSASGSDPSAPDALPTPDLPSAPIPTQTSITPTEAGAEVKGKVSLSAVRRLLQLTTPYRRLQIIAAFMALLNSAITLSMPILTQRAINDFARVHQERVLDQLAMYLIGLIVLGSIVGYVQYIMMAYIGNRIVMELRRRLFGHLQRLPVSFFDRMRSGDLTSHLSNDVTQLQQTLTDDLVRMLGNLITLVCGIALAIKIDWQLCLMVVFLLALVMSFFVVNGKRLRVLNRASLDALSHAMGAMSEAFANIRLVKAFAREPYEDGRANERLDSVFTLSMRGSRIEGAFATVAFSGFVLVLLGVVWYGGHSVLNGTLSPGSLIAFLLTITIISGPMGSLTVQYARLQRAIGASDRLFALLDTPPEDADAADAVAFPDGPGHVTFQNVDFAYTPDTPVLRGLTLDVPPGKVTALVGPSGSGKTTLSSLLYRFYETQAGAITIDGVAVTAIQRHDLREHIGLVPQDPVLFSGTLRDNIRYGKLAATDADVEAAARAANVAEFAGQFTDGYDTLIGERGVTLSGGQRQRVAIARAVLKNPRILILDEATSALDTRSELLVREALERLMRGRTTLVIAHRLTTIQDADQIAVLERGQIVEVGRHADLLQLAGRYADLHGQTTTQDKSNLVPD